MSTATRTRDELTEQAANAAIEQACRILHLLTCAPATTPPPSPCCATRPATRPTWPTFWPANATNAKPAARFRAVKAAGFPRLKRLRLSVVDVVLASI
jgi:hypothetical protein